MNSSKRTRRITSVLVGAAVAIGVLALSGTATGATVTTHEHQGKKPTIVLEHGAFAETFSWNGVIERLQKEGYLVIATGNPLRGPGSHAAVLRQRPPPRAGERGTRRPFLRRLGHSEAVVGEPR